MSGLVTWIADHLIHHHEHRLDVRLRGHSGLLINNPTPHYYFLNVWNASLKRAATVTQV